MNELKFPVTAKTMMQYLDYRLRADEERQYFEVFVAENISTMAAQMKTKTRVNYSQNRDKIWNKQVADDSRTAEEIIRDTFKKHGLTIKEGGEGA